MFKGVANIAIAVRDLEEGVAAYEKLGLKLERRAVNERLGITQAFFRLGDYTQIELMEPVQQDAAVARSLARRGEGIHLLSVAVDNVQEAAKEMKARGVQLIEDGTTVYVHPHATHGVLFLLTSRPESTSSAT